MILEIYRLVLTDGTMYYIVQTQTGYEIRSTDFHSLQPTLAATLHVLGGMVEWNAWTPDAQFVLRHLNHGSAI